MTLKEKTGVICRSLVLALWTFMLSLMSRKNLTLGHDELIVSLTSYGRRLRFVFLTIESILQQSTAPKAVILWLFKDDVPRGLSAWILRRQQRRGLIIRYVDRDTRSFKKLSPLIELQEIAFEFVVTADDDIFYPGDWLSGFREHYLQDAQSVYCYRARIISVSADGETLLKYSLWPLADRAYSNGNAIIPTGVSGICYPRAALSADVFDYSAIEQLCPTADDIWYKMVCRRHHYPARVITEKSVHFTPLPSGFSKGLEKYNVLNDRNSVQFMAAMRHFGLTIDDFVPATDRKRGS